MGWPSSLKTWITGDALNATNLNAQIRDPLAVLGGAWATYTPSLTATTTNPTMGSSTITGRYRLVGVAGTAGSIDIDIDFTVGAGFAAGTGNWLFGLPSGITPLNTGTSTWRGGGMTRDVSVPTAKSLTVYHFSTTAVGAIVNSTDAILGASTPFTWATGDRVILGMRAMEIT